MTTGIEEPFVPIPTRRWQRPSLARNSTLRNPLTIIGIVIAVGWILIAIFAPLLSPHDPLAQTLPPLHAPNWTYPFGTDELGRDVLSRTLYGARETIPIGLLLVLIAMVIGSTLGAIAGYFGGVIDGIVMRLTDLVFAFPAIVLAMVTTAALGRGIRNAVIALIIVSWPSYARVVRGLVRQMGQSEYVLSSRLLGASASRALVRDVLPNIAGPILVLATLDLGSAILLLSGLSFLGLGAQPPTPEWGLGVAEGVNYFQDWWIGTFPGLAIFTVVLAFNFLGDSLRDAFDPQSSWAHGGDEE
jgi:ABC-type dipeptide/oligopeptide/nickel transport system permease subunit